MRGGVRLGGGEERIALWMTGQVCTTVLGKRKERGSEG